MPSRRLALLVSALVLVAGCATAVPGRPVADGAITVALVDTGFLRGTDGGPIDRLAATVVVDIEDYWRATFPAAFDRPWADVAGGYHSVDSSDQAGSPPPCARDVTEVEGRAFYCPGDDAIAWDRAALLPVLQDQFGDASVIVVLAHEIGHAVHHRIGVASEQGGQQGGNPSILLEAMADCYAGAVMRHIGDGQAARLRIRPDQLDRALSALVTFRDPVGTPVDSATAHGNGFDRVSSFQDGYEQGPQRCAGFSLNNREFTQEQFGGLTDLARGDLPLDELLPAIEPDLDEYFSRLVGSRGGQWQRPDLRTVPRGQVCAAGQGTTALCPAGGAIEVDTSDELPRIHDEIGDYATGALLASRYALAALDGLDLATEGARARAATLCLAGAYTNRVLNRDQGFRLSPGDLNEAVQVLLSFDYGSRDAAGRGIDSGFERVAAFRAGTVNGTSACELNG